ncbi:bis(5'-nucleosyl)-tetraphosphatase (symmetrical) YqeK [Lachnospiraceae bacterium KK002]
MKRTEIEKKLKKELDKERYTHTLGVMYTAAALAMAHHANLEQAMYAGLLHDCAKCVSSRDKFKLCKKYDIPISPSEERSPFLLHAKLGAFFAQKYYETDDEDILHAIQVHTTGAPNMNTLDKIIYIADYIEPNRDKAPDLEEVRKMAFEDLDRTMLKILSDTLDYLKRKGGELDPMTMESYQYFKNQAKQEDI